MRIWKKKLKEFEKMEENKSDKIEKKFKEMKKRNFFEKLINFSPTKFNDGYPEKDQWLLQQIKWRWKWEKEKLSFEKDVISQICPIHYSILA